MPLYESTFIARHDMSSQQVDTLAETFAGVVREHGGEVTKKEHWGLRNLAYRIKKNRKGHYVLFNIDAPPYAVQELQRNLRLNEDVLRFLTVRVEQLDPNPSAIMQSRAAREERSRRGGAGARARAEPAETAQAVSEEAESKDAETEKPPETKEKTETASESTAQHDDVEETEDKA